MTDTKIYICDIDGTIADLTHRLHFIENKPPDWDGFFDACDVDEPIQEVIDTVNALSDSGAEIILISGRSDAVREKTIEWLDDKLNCWHGFYLRKSGDHRPDNIVKSELLDSFLSERKISESCITGAFEDRDQVVKMYRDRGIRVFQVAEGNF